LLNVVRVEFSKLRRWKLLRVLPLLSLVLPAITFSYFATHPDYLTDMGLYKQALFSFNIFLILPAILGVLASLLVYNEQRCDVLKQLWIIPMSKGSYLFAKWVVVLTASLAFMMLAVGFTFVFGLAFGFLSWNGEMMAFVLYKGIEAAVFGSGGGYPDSGAGGIAQGVPTALLRSDCLCFSGLYRGPDEPVPDSLGLCYPLYFKRSAQYNNALCLSADFCRTLFWRMGSSFWILLLSWTFGKVRKTQCRL